MIDIGSTIPTVCTFTRMAEQDMVASNMDEKFIREVLNNER